jgi:hypothetical protein
MSRLIVVMLIAFCSVGCGPQRPPMAKVTGKVTYRNKPLTFGSLQFQPAAGQPGRGYIQPDGTFELSTYGDRDGAAIGKHTVRITCLTSQDPNAKPTQGETPTGTSLIPAKYGALATTPLVEIEVKEINEPMVFDLKD